MNTFFKALLVYKSIYGDLNIPRLYIVPKDELYDRDCWGMKLGLKVNNIRYRGDYSEYLTQLKETIT